MDRDGTDSSADEDLDLLDRVSDELAAVDKVLSRIDGGRYGTCELCGQPLDRGVLEADPLVVRCPEHGESGADRGPLT